MDHPDSHLLSSPQHDHLVLSQIEVLRRKGYLVCTMEIVSLCCPKKAPKYHLVFPGRTDSGKNTGAFHKGRIFVRETKPLPEKVKRLKISFNGVSKNLFIYSVIF